jgi:hypothetical protein
MQNTAERCSGSGVASRETHVVLTRPADPGIELGAQCRPPAAGLAAWQPGSLAAWQPGRRASRVLLPAVNRLGIRRCSFVRHHALAGSAGQTSQRVRPRRRWDSPLCHETGRGTTTPQAAPVLYERSTQERRTVCNHTSRLACPSGVREPFAALLAETKDRLGDGIRARARFVARGHSSNEAVPTQEG